MTTLFPTRRYSDLARRADRGRLARQPERPRRRWPLLVQHQRGAGSGGARSRKPFAEQRLAARLRGTGSRTWRHGRDGESLRSEEHTSELQSLMRHSYAVFCLQKKKKKKSLY